MVIHLKALRLGGICSDFSCAKCCYETEMILSRKDIQRIVALGFEATDFCFYDDNGFPRLRNVNNACFFLNENKCRIYSSRPQGCRYYPLIYDSSLDKVVFDTDCPLSNQLSPKIISTFEREIRKFIKTLLSERVSK